MLSLFAPGREHSFKGKMPNWSKAVLRCEAQGDGSVLLYQHSGFGAGTKSIPDPNDLTVTVSRLDEDERKDVPILSEFSRCHNVAEDTFDSVWNNIEALLPAKHYAERPLRRRTAQRAISMCLGRSALAGMAPKAKIYQPSSNVRQDLKTTLSPPGMGRGNAQMQQQKRLSRAESRKRKAEDSEEEVRAKKRSRGLHLCDLRCPNTGRYCRCDFLSEDGLAKHTRDGGKHCSFPKGLSSRDTMLLTASKAGGPLALGSRPNRMAGSAMHGEIVESAEGAPGSMAAICYRKFHRPTDRRPYYKPEPTIAFLKEQFEMVPHRTAEQVHEAMKAKRKPDGGAYFSYSQRGEVKIYAKTSPEWQTYAGCSMCGLKPCSGCNGRVLSVEEIKQIFSSWASKRRKTARSKA